MSETLASTVTWGLVIAFDTVLLYGVQYRDTQGSVLEQGARTAGVVMCVLVWSIVLFSVYTWGFGSVFMYNMLLAAVVTGDMRAWRTASDHQCAILACSGVQVLCVCLLGSYAAVEGDVYNVLCSLGVYAARGDVAVLRMLTGVLALCSVTASLLAVNLALSDVQRPDVLPWDSIYVVSQLVMLVLACILFSLLEQRAVPAAVYAYRDAPYGFVC